MKKLLLIACYAISFGAFAQVQMNKPIQLTGSGNDAKIEGIKVVQNDEDATNKKYVDSLVAANSGGSSSNLVFSLSTNNTATTAPKNGSSSGITPVILKVNYVSGEGAPVALSVFNVPPGISYDLSPSGGYPSFEAELDFFPDNSASTGSYPIKVKAVGPNNADSLTITLNVVAGNRVFLSSNQYTGNLGGTSGADGICQSLADAQSLGGTWMAWISSSSSSPSSRFTQSGSYYLLLDGTPIANSWADLTDDNLLTSISLDELGNTYTSSSQLVWANTKEDATIHNILSTYHCSDWTSTSGNGRAGRNSAGGDWHGDCCSEACDGSTAGLLRLYCFEQ